MLSTQRASEICVLIENIVDSQSHQNQGRTEEESNLEAAVDVNCFG